MLMSVLPACMHYTHSWCLQRPKEGDGCTGIGVTDGYELPCGCWDSNCVPLGEHPVSLTPEPSL